MNNSDYESIHAQTFNSDGKDYWMQLCQVRNDEIAQLKKNYGLEIEDILH